MKIPVEGGRERRKERVRRRRREGLRKTSEKSSCYICQW